MPVVAKETDVAFVPPVVMEKKTQEYIFHGFLISMMINHLSI